MAAAGRHIGKREEPGKEIGGKFEIQILKNATQKHLFPMHLREYNDVTAR